MTSIRAITDATVAGEWMTRKIVCFAERAWLWDYCGNPLPSHLWWPRAFKDCDCGEWRLQKVKEFQAGSPEGS